MSQNLYAYLFISTALLSMGLFGFLARRNLIAMLISLELILNSASINFLAFNKFCLTDKSLGQVFTIFIIALAAAEVCVALSIILLLSRKKNAIYTATIKDLKG